MWSSLLFRKILGFILILLIMIMVTICFFGIPDGLGEIGFGLRFRLFCLGSAIGALSFAAAYWFLKFSLAPLTYLSEMSARILKGDFSDNRYIAGYGEIGILGAVLYYLKNGLENVLLELKIRRQEGNIAFRKNEQMRGYIYDLKKDKKKLSEDVESMTMQLEALKRSEDRYRTMLENIEEGYYEMDLLGNLIFFNDSLYNMLGYSRNDMVGMNYRNFTDAENGDKLHGAFEWAYNTGRSDSIFDLKLIKFDATLLYAEVSVTPIKDSDGNAMGFRGIIRDVSVRREYQEKLEYLVYHDELTGLYNRKAFFEKLKDVVGQSERDRKEKHVLFMDLDKFKQVNDNLGHETGDWLLVEVAKRLQHTLRQTDYICRLGGDEFTVVLNNINEPAPDKAAQRIIDALSKPYDLNGNIVDFIKISIGIAEYPSDARDISTLVNYADTAMFEAKKVGNRYIFYRDISDKPSEVVPMLYVVK